MHAGLAGGGYLADMDYNIVERTFAVNVHGTFRTINVGLLSAASPPHLLVLVDLNDWPVEPNNRLKNYA